MKMKTLTVCDCPTPHCGKSLDITDWDKEDPIICMCCCEHYDWEEIDQSTIRETQVRDSGF